MIGQLMLGYADFDFVLGEKKKKRKISRLYCGSVWVYGYVILMGEGVVKYKEQ